MRTTPIRPCKARRPGAAMMSNLRAMPRPPRGPISECLASCCGRELSSVTAAPLPRAARCTRGELLGNTPKLYHHWPKRAKIGAADRRLAETGNNLYTDSGVIALGRKPTPRVPCIYIHISALRRMHNGPNCGRIGWNWAPGRENDCSHEQGPRGKSDTLGSIQSRRYGRRTGVSTTESS